MASGRLRDYLGKGLLVERPASLDLQENSVGLWLSEDTGVFSYWNGTVWEDLASAAALAELTDVDLTTTPPTNGQVLVYDEDLLMWIPADQSGGGGGGSEIHLDMDMQFRPPLAADFDYTPRSFRGGDATLPLLLSDDEFAGLIVRGPGVQAPAVKPTIRDIPVGMRADFEFIARIKSGGWHPDMQNGICVGTGDAAGAFFFLNFSNVGGQQTLQWCQGNADGSWNDGIYGRLIPNAVTWMKLKVDGTRIRGYFSSDGRAWTLFTDQANPLGVGVTITRYGFMMGAYGVVADWAFSVPYFESTEFPYDPEAVVTAGGGGGGGSGVDGWADLEPLVAHKYWRVVAYQAQNDTGFAYPAGMIFMDGATDLIGTYTNNLATAGIAAQLTSRNGGSYVAMGALPAWFMVEYPAPVLPDRVEWWSRNGFAVQMPQCWSVECSDDGITWTHVMHMENCDYEDNAGHQYLFRPYILNIDFGVFAIDGANVCVNRLAIEDSTGAVITGPNINANPEVRGQYISQVGNRADMVPVWSNTPQDNGYYGNRIYLSCELRFPTLPDLKKFAFTCRSGYGKQGPKFIELRKSRDGINYYDYVKSPPLMWAGPGTTKKFLIDQPTT